MSGGKGQFQTTEWAPKCLPLNHSLSRVYISFASLL